MFDFIKQAMFTGMGLASLTKERLEELSSDLSKHAQLSAEQAAKFKEDLTRRAAEAKQEMDSEVEKRVEAVLHKLKLVRADELATLKARVERLERELASRSS